jgi:hypothetical protein
MSKRFPIALAAVAAALLTATPAHADRIDGSWCSPDGKSMTIAGRRITTPAGTEMHGDYTRHTFSYDVPENEPGAGDHISAQQLNEQTIAVTV